MSVLNEGDKAPDFKLPTDAGDIVSLKDFAGRKLVLYFYPKDDTPGCTTQACTFNDKLPKFGRRKTSILGVSKDSVESHQKFAKKFSLKFPLASDESGTMLEAYGVWVEKSMYGKKYMGIDRSTFLIDENGIIEKIWRSVKVQGHIYEVLKEVGEKEVD